MLNESENIKFYIHINVYVNILHTKIHNITGNLSELFIIVKKIDVCSASRPIVNWLYVLAFFVAF